MTASTHGILIRTYHKDAERLLYCLSSIQRYCTGFTEVVVVCPETSCVFIEPVVSRFDFAVLKSCPAYTNDFIGQQITKMRAHQFISSDFIFHVDSDCVFNQDFEPSLYFVDALPCLFHREYGFFYEQGVDMPWQYVTSTYMRRQVDLEFMALFPLVYPRRIYDEMERWFVDTHGMSYEGIEDRLKNKQEFSEFNLLGAFSYYDPLKSGPFHRHINWGHQSATHYLDQFAQLGQREDRTLLSQEMQRISALLR